MKNFWLGKIVDSFHYDFDGDEVEVLKYHPSNRHKLNSTILKYDSNQTLYHCENLKESFYSLESLLISWIARKHLGQNQYALTTGICKALNIKFHE
jgi:hypothetical protein